MCVCVEWGLMRVGCWGGEGRCVGGGQGWVWKKCMV